MENIKVTDGQWHVKIGKKWHMRSNFIFSILYEVAHPQDSIYVVDVTTDDGQKGEAFFKAGDLHNPKDFQTALNRTFRIGTLLCHFKQTELLHLVANLASEARKRAQSVTYRRRTIANAGRQDGTSLIFLSPTQILDLTTGSLIHPMDCPLIWLRGDLCQLRGPKLDLARHIQIPTGSLALQHFIEKAEGILNDNIGPAILAWSAMYGLNLYTKWIEELRHFNLPLLFGPPTAGKTLIAQCAAWLTGCSELHIASRCTLAFITSWLTTSSLPFVWDDPTSSDEVSQLAIDLGNGAVRGRANDETRKPLTGCLVTANFDMSAAYKYFSRLFVLKIEKTKHQKKTGDARRLEDAAREASSALPVVLSALNTVTAADVNKEVENLQSVLRMDIRILEGIALPMVLARMVLNAARRYDLMGAVLAYIKDILVPYYQECLTPADQEVIGAENLTLEDSAFADILRVCNLPHEDQVATIVSNSFVAVRADQVKAKKVREQVVKVGGKTNHSVRLRGKPKKCLYLPKKILSSEQWETLASAILKEAPTAHPAPLAEEQMEEGPQLATPATSPKPTAAPTTHPAPPAEDQMEEGPRLATLATSLKPTAAFIPPTPQTDEEMEVSTPSVPDTSADLPNPSSVPEIEGEETPPAVPTACDGVPTCSAKASPCLPFPVRKSNSETETCFKCKRVGSKYLHWIGCDSCGKWYHRKCTNMTNKEYVSLNGDSTWHCVVCKPDS